MSLFVQNSILRSFAIVAGLASAALAAPVSAATVTISFSANGLPAIGGVINGVDLTGDVGRNNFTTGTGTSAVAVSVANGAAVVQGSLGGSYAAPVTGSSGATYSAPYFSTGGTPGTVTLKFASAQSYLGFLWGSIGTGDTLSFLSNGTSVGSITGVQAQALAAGFNGAAGAQGYGGSQYTLVNLTGGTFDTVVLGQTGLPSFEAAAFEFAAQNVSSVPEPTSIALAGMALVGCIAFKRKS